MISLRTGLIYITLNFFAAFKGDVMMLTAARQEIRSKLEVNLDIKHQYPAIKSNLAYFFFSNTELFFALFSSSQSARQVTDPAQLEQMLTEGREAAEFLKTSIVQAVTNDRGHVGKYNFLLFRGFLKKF